MNEKYTEEKEDVGFVITMPVKFPTAGACLKWMREQNGMTQVKLAKKLKTTQSAIARLENQKRHPSLKMLYKVSEALGFRLEPPKLGCKKCRKEISECNCKKP